MLTQEINLIGKRNKNYHQESNELRLPEEGEVLGQVIQALGNRLFEVRCVDGEIRQMRVAGKHRRRMWVNMGDVVALVPDYGMQEHDKGTMTHRYKSRGAKKLLKQELIPEEYVE